MSNLSNFITKIIDRDLKSGLEQVITRFPPEPNGRLHIGHAKSIYLNYTLAAQYYGKCHLRYDDINPVTSSQEYVDGIRHDLQWLGYNPDPLIFYASDSLERIFNDAARLIELGLAYVCFLSPSQISASRGSYHKPGENSPSRDRIVSESLELFKKMREGAYTPGSN